MKKKNKILVALMIINFIFVDMVFANSFNIEKVKEQGTPIVIEEGELTKKITDINQEKREVSIQLNLKLNKTNTIKGNTEIILLNDNSSSMGKTLEGTNNTRKKEIIKFEKQLVTNINKNNNNIKIGIVNFSSSASVLQKLTSNTQELNNAFENSESKKPAGNTQMLKGINLAKSKFSKEANNKILILVTDGLPSDNAKSIKNSLKDSDIYIITTLVGLDNATNAQKQTINNTFGSQKNPVADKFYNISDTQIEETINKNIYSTIVENFKEVIKNLTIEDYFPEYIINNFEISIQNPTKGTVDKNDNKILWNISEINTSENANLTYILKLKENYDSNIINKVMDTNDRVELKYNNPTNTVQTKIMEDSPQIILRNINNESQKEQTESVENNVYKNENVVNTVNKNENKSNNISSGRSNNATTTNANKLPKAGYENSILIGLTLISAYGILMGIKMKSIH